MWIAVCTHPHRELQAIDNLQRQGYEVYCPMTAKERRHARRTDTVRRPLFPGYVFVSLGGASPSVRSINSTYGVRSLVKFGDALGELPEGFVRALKEREVEGVIPPPPLAQLLPQGSRVMIKEGAFKDLMATVIGCGVQDRVIVLMDLLKRSVKAGVSARYIEKTS